SSPRVDSAAFVDGAIWWGESVPSEGGRVTVRSSSGEQVLPGPWNARSRVHEYGGGAWAAAGGVLYFVEASDQPVHRLRPGAEPEPLTAPGPNHGGLRLQQGRLFAVREDLSKPEHERSMVETALDGSEERIVAARPGVVAHPALSRDGTRLAWVQWDADRMPWDAAQLHVAALDGSSHAAPETRAVLQPGWLGDDAIVYADDPTGRWNLYRLALEGTA